MEVLVKIAQLLVSLSILIVLHELGHYTLARIFKVRVEKFYLFFDAGFSLFRKKIGDTEYGIGWLPLGGYVKISGMIDVELPLPSFIRPDTYFRACAHGHYCEFLLFTNLAGLDAKLPCLVGAEIASVVALESEVAVAEILQKECPALATGHIHNGDLVLRSTIAHQQILLGVADRLAVGQRSLSLNG